MLRYHLVQVYVSFSFFFNYILVFPFHPSACPLLIHPSLSHIKTHLHPEERDAGQQINSRFQILETLWVSRREIILI